MGGFVWPAENTERQCENTIHEVKGITRVVGDCLISEVFGVGAWEKGCSILKPYHTGERQWHLLIEQTDG